MYSVHVCMYSGVGVQLLHIHAVSLLQVAVAAKNDVGQFDPPLPHPTVFQKVSLFAPPICSAHSLSTVVLPCQITRTIEVTKEVVNFVQTMALYTHVFELCFVH